MDTFKEQQELNDMYERAMPVGSMENMIHAGVREFDC